MTKSILILLFFFVISSEALATNESTEQFISKNRFVFQILNNNWQWICDYSDFEPQTDNPRPDIKTTEYA